MYAMIGIISSAIIVSQNPYHAPLNAWLNSCKPLTCIYIILIAIKIEIFAYSIMI